MYVEGIAVWSFTNCTAMCTQAGMHIICLPECISIACAVHSVLTLEIAEFSNKCASPFGIYSKPAFKVAVCHTEGGLGLQKGWTPHLFPMFYFYNLCVRHCPHHLAAIPLCLHSQPWKFPTTLPSLFTWNIVTPIWAQGGVQRWNLFWEGRQHNTIGINHVIFLFFSMSKTSSNIANILLCPKRSVNVKYNVGWEGKRSFSCIHPLTSN